MKHLLFLVFPFIYFLSNYTYSIIGTNEIVNSKNDKFTIIESNKHISFADLKPKYDTLIPIFDGLFITYNKIDSNLFRKVQTKIKKDAFLETFSGDLITKNTKKWGVVDSTGKIIVPFICDGAKAISENKGVVSVFSNSYSLNTGIPRYKYLGTYFFFTKNGLMRETEKEFNITVQFISDWHRAEFVILKGPDFFLPAEYRTKKKY